MKKTLLVGIVALFLATGTAYATNRVSWTCARITAKEDYHFVNVRKEPNDKSEIITKKLPGTILNITTMHPDTKRDWSYVVIEDDAGTTQGYIASKYLEKIDAEPPDCVPSWLQEQK